MATILPFLPRAAYDLARRSLQPVEVPTQDLLTKPVMKHCESILTLLKTTGRFTPAHEPRMREIILELRSLCHDVNTTTLPSTS